MGTPAVVYRNFIISRIGRRIDVTNEHGSIGTFPSWTHALEFIDRLLKGGTDERATLA